MPPFSFTQSTTATRAPERERKREGRERDEKFAQFCTITEGKPSKVQTWLLLNTTRGRFLENCAQLLHRTPNFLTVFLGVEIEHQKMTNFYICLQLFQAKNPD